MAALVGRWQADSAFSVDDTRATQLGAKRIMLEIFPDTSYSQAEPFEMEFPVKADGAYSLSGDTLIVFPKSAPPDTFIVKLRFLGNYLELDHPADQRYAFFHKIKFVDTAAVPDLLGDSLWRLEGRRLRSGVFRSEPQIRDFAYLRFADPRLAAGTMRMDARMDGIGASDSGPLARNGSVWNWKASQGARDYQADLVTEDSLRLWPLTEGRPDSGFFLYVRAGRIHRFDIDVRPLLGHMRNDSVLYRKGELRYHYGQFYDWTFGADHSVAIETNMSDVPLFRSWTLDSGLISLQGPGIPVTRFRLDTAGASVILSADSGLAFGKQVEFHQTKVDPALFLNNPLERFQSASYFQLVVSGDTSDYFFSANNFSDRFEIADQAGDSAAWVSLTLDKSAETAQSGNPGFFFAFQGRTDLLGRYTCKSSPALELVVRQPLPASAMAQGTVQGACRILSADSAFSDSALTLEARFRFLRKNTGSQLSPLWSR
jgi:hypothetical protein